MYGFGLLERRRRAVEHLRARHQAARHFEAGATIR